MIENLLKAENCVVVDGVADWKEAIEVSLEKLVAQGYCTKDYIQAVFAMTEQYGPYYVLTEDMALIHASQSGAVNETQMAVTVLKKPVKFRPDGDDITILVALVAKDSTSHMEGIRAVSNLFADEAQVKKIKEAQDGQTIFNLFKENA